MKNMIHIRNSVIILLCITVVCMGVGFVVLSMELKNKKEETVSFDVSFRDVRKTSSVKGSNVEPTGTVEVIENGKELDMEFYLNATHDELSYVVTIQNNGTLSAEIVDVIESPNYREEVFRKISDPVTIQISDVKGKIIPPGEEIELKIVVYYAPGSVTDVKRVIPYRLGLITKSR